MIMTREIVRLHAASDDTPRQNPEAARQKRKLSCWLVNDAVWPSEPFSMIGPIEVVGVALIAGSGGPPASDGYRGRCGPISRVRCSKQEWSLEPLREWRGAKWFLSRPDGHHSELRLPLNGRRALKPAVVFFPLRTVPGLQMHGLHTSPTARRPYKSPCPRPRRFLRPWRRTPLPL